MGSAVSSPSGSGQSPAAKRYLVHFGLKNASSDSNFKGTFTEMFVFSLFTSNNATSLGGTNTNILRQRHVISCCSLSQFVQFVICRYLVVTGHCSEPPTAVSL